MLTLADGLQVEVSRNFYAISRRTNSVYYLGEEVDVYQGGRMVGHEGAWESGREGARFGLMMPGVREYKYFAPGIGLLQDGSLKSVSFGGGDRSDPDSSGEATSQRG